MDPPEGDKKNEMTIQAAEMKFLRSLQGYSLLDKKYYEEIRQTLGIQSLNEITEENRRRWCEHIDVYKRQL